MDAIRSAAPGVTQLGPFGPYRNSVWLFHHGSEAAVMEMPPYLSTESEPWSQVGDFCRSQGYFLKYAFLSHIHLDHCQSLGAFRMTFGETQFVGHRSQAESRLCRRLAADHGLRSEKLFDQIFDGDIKVLDLAGEPLVLLHCPKHSPTDQFLIFRGTAMTGDWYLGDLKDCNALVATDDKIRSVDRVQSWLKRLDYRVSRAFSAHGDCLYYDVDFPRLLERSKIDHDAE